MKLAGGISLVRRTVPFELNFKRMVLPVQDLLIIGTIRRAKYNLIACMMIMLSSLHDVSSRSTDLLGASARFTEFGSGR